MLVWMDLEMTGLDPLRNTIVEIATIVTDDDLQVVAEGPDLVVRTSQEQLDSMEQVVRDMHTRSGLLDAIAASDLSLEDAGAQTLEFIRSHVPEPGTVPLCGSSIGTDRRFLAAQLPSIENWLHYRCIDVSTLKELCRRWYPKVFKGAPPKRTTHRALDDVRESIAELAYYRSSIFVPVPSPTPSLRAPSLRFDGQRTIGGQRHLGDVPRSPGNAALKDLGGGAMATMSIEEANAVLTASGQMFEMEDLEIRGVVTRTWKNCPASLRVVLDLSRGHGDKTSSSTRTNAPRSNSITASQPPSPARSMSGSASRKAIASRSR